MADGEKTQTQRIGRNRWGLRQTRPMKEIGNYLENGKQRKNPFSSVLTDQKMRKKLIDWLGISGARIASLFLRILINAVVALRSVKSERRGQGDLIKHKIPV